MKKFSNKGFVLAETIIVAVFMVTIFTVLYSNYYPIMGNFEKREFYDDIDSKYIAFWLKYMIQDTSYASSGLPTGSGIYYKPFSCQNIGNSTKQKTCIGLVRESGLSTNPYCNGLAGTCAESGNLTYVAYIVKVVDGQGIINFKNDVNSTSLGSKLSDGFIDYINYLPDYKSKTGYRLIIELYDNKVTGRKPIYKYASIEVKK